MEIISRKTTIEKRNLVFSASLFLFGILAQCNSADKNDMIFQLNPPLNTSIRYSISKSYSEFLRTSRNSFDSTVFEIVFVERDDSIFSSKLYLKYLSSLYPNGRKVSTLDSVERNWGRDFIMATSFLQKHLITDSFWIVMHMNGTILRVDGFDSIVNRLSRQFAIDKRTVRSFLNERVGNAAIHDMLSQLFFYLPAKAVKKDDNWVKNVMVSVKAPMKYSNFIKVRDINADTILLDVQSAVTARTGEGGTIYEEGKRTLDMHVSRTTGLPIMWSGVEETVYTAQRQSVRKKVVIKGQRL